MTGGSMSTVPPAVRVARFRMLMLLMIPFDLVIGVILWFVVGTGPAAPFRVFLLVAWAIIAVLGFVFGYFVVPRSAGFR